MKNTSLRFRFEWESGDRVRAPELRSTWARLEIWVGTECISLVEDVETGSVRRSIYCSLYPLAEWVAYNWWFLRVHSRPASLHPTKWTYRSLRLHRSNGRNWLARHNLRGSGDGFSWPDVTLIPEGQLTRVVWNSDDSLPSHRPIRFIRHGQAFIESESVLGSLADLVEAVLTRLAEEGVTDTTLEHEWTALAELEPEELAFCESSARLGLDPFSEGQNIAQLIEDAATQLDGQLLQDFLNAVDQGGVESGLTWVTQASDLVEQREGTPSPTFEKIRSKIEGRGRLRNDAIFNAYHMPWEIGWNQARRLRTLMAIEPKQHVSLEGMLEVEHVPSRDRALEAVGGRSRASVPVLVAGREMVEESRRFTVARALWHFLFGGDDRRFLLTTAHAERQKIERAFATELMAPAEGIASLLDGDAVDEEDLEKIAKHFRISSWVIRHQIEDQLYLRTLDAL